MAVFRLLTNGNKPYWQYLLVKLSYDGLKRISIFSVLLIEWTETSSIF